MLPDDDELRLMERILSVTIPFLASVVSNPEKTILSENKEVLSRRYDKNNEFILEHEVSVIKYMSENPEPMDIPVVYDDLMIKRIQKVAKKAKATWEVDISIAPNAREINGENVFPSILLVADKGSQNIFHAGLTGPDNMEDLQLAFLNVIETHKIIPKKLQIRYTRNNMYIFGLLEKLAIDLEIVDELEVIPLKKKEIFNLLKDYRLDD